MRDDADPTIAEPDDAELVSRAATGDTRAGDAFFRRHLEFLRAMARRIGVDIVDPDDLLNEAMTEVWRKWDAGVGPRDHALAYVITAMRNRVRDELRSSRRRLSTPLDDEDHVAQEDPRYRHVEFHHEADLIRRALATLAPDQQGVLRAVLIDDRKPRDLEIELGRPATALSSLLRRAKLRLRRALLQQILLDGAVDDECRRAAGRLPEHVPLDADVLISGLHCTQCAACRSGVTTFIGMSGMLPD